MSWWRKLSLNAALVASNVVFFALSIWLLAAGARVRRAGWLDVFEDEYPWFHVVYVLLVVLLSLLIASLAISGLYSVLCRRKQWVLLVYAASALLTFTCCLFLTVEGGISLTTAHAWEARAAAFNPVVERNVATNFNHVYCVSQAAYLCTASANSQWLVHFGSEDLRDLYLDQSVASTIKQAMTAERTTAARSLLELCEDESSPLHTPILSESLAGLCTWCGNVANLKSYVHIVSWANSKCPPSRPSAQFCIQNVWLQIANPETLGAAIESPDGIFAMGQGSGQTQGDQATVGSAQHELSPHVDRSNPASRRTSGGGGGRPDSMSLTDVMPRTAPYAICRKTFLSYWSYLSLWFLLLSLLLLGFMVVVIRIAYVVLRTKPDRYSAHHGKKPERKPLVQLASRPTTAGAATSTTNRPTQATQAKPSGASAVKAKAKALFSPKGKSSK